MNEVQQLPPLGYISKEPVTHKTVQDGDIVCLPHWPYKPFEVFNKSDKGLALRCEHPIRNSCWFFKLEFDKAGYHLSDQGET